MPSLEEVQEQERKTQASLDQYKADQERLTEMQRENLEQQKRDAEENLRKAQENLNQFTN